MAEWDHTKQEKDLIKEFGGQPSESFGVDGSISGDPVEVRLAKEEDRFRLNKDTHQTLESQDGSYIFDNLEDNQPPKQVEADNIDDMLEEDWHSDRGYMHQFVDVDAIF
jgi:hypothetical protein